MDSGLTGKRALVGGGGAGIGHGIATALAAEGATVALLGRTRDRLQEAASTLGGHAIVQDLANEDGPAAAVFEAVDAMGGLDLLVANTGGPAPGAFDALDDDAWLGAIEGTLLSVLRLIRAALPHLRAGTDPAILINLSSSVREPIPALTALERPAAGPVRSHQEPDGRDRADPHQRPRAGPHLDRSDRLPGRKRAEAANRTVEEIQREMEGRSRWAGTATSPRSAGSARSCCRRRPPTSRARSWRWMAGWFARCPSAAPPPLTHCAPRPSPARLHRQMTTTCPSCERPVPASSTFCPECGAKLATARPPAGEVRKTVTILFADVAGSTALGERLDPEALRSLMTRYFATMREVIERHGGTVEKFIGDAVMAVFGIPTVHEDDGLRAVRAAGEIRDVLANLNEGLERDRGIAIRFRIGVNTGEVVAGEPGTGTTLVTGDAVNTAARLEQAAQPGEYLLGRMTYDLVRDAVDVEPVDPVAAKGKAEPVAAWRLRSVGTATEGRARLFDTPLVGRRAELGALADAWRRAVDERSPHLVALSAPPGVGKSRLVREFLASIESDARVLVGRALSYGDGIRRTGPSERLSVRPRASSRATIMTPPERASTGC